MGNGILKKHLVFLVLGCFFLHTYSQQPALMLPVGHSDRVNTASYSPDGKYIVTASKDNTAKLWSASDGKLLMEFKGHTDNVVSARFSPDNQFLVTGSYDSTAKIWRIADGKLLREIKHGGYVYSVIFNPVNAQGQPGINSILTACSDSAARIWDISSGKMLLEMKVPGFMLNARYSPNQKLVLTTSADSVVRCWDILTGKIIKEIRLPGILFYNAIFSPSTSEDKEGGSHILMSCSDHTIKIWDLHSNQVIHSFGVENNRYPIYSPSYSPDGKSILTISTNLFAEIWSLDGQLIKQINLDGHLQINTANFSPDGKRIIVSCLDYQALVFDIEDGKQLFALKGHTGAGLVRSSSYSPDGKYLITASKDGWIWNTSNGKLIRKLNDQSRFGLSSAIYSPVCSTDATGGKFIATSSCDSTARVWDAATGKQLLVLKGHNNFVINIAYSNDGKYLLTTSSDSTAKIWDAGNGKLLRTLPGHLDRVSYAVFSPDGKYVLTSCYDHVLKIWDATNGSVLRVIDGCSGTRYSGSFSLDSKSIMMATHDSTARVFDISSGKQMMELENGIGLVRTALYSPDGKYILTSSYDNMARVWDANTGKLLHELSGHTNMVYQAVYSADGKNIITNSFDNVTRVWDSGTNELLYSFVQIDDNDYLQFDKDGHYDGTEKARGMLYYTCGLEAIELDQFKDLSWEPGLVSKILGNNKEPITAKKISEINICDNSPRVEELGLKEGIYHYEIIPRQGGVGEIQLYVNGKQVKTYLPTSLDLKNGSYHLDIKQEAIQNYFVSTNNNQIMVKATTANGTISSRGVPITVNGWGKKLGNVPNMYIVAIGISKYKNEKLRLGYASKDAADFASAVDASAKKLLNTDARQHVNTYLFNTDSINNHWPAKDAIIKTLDSISQKSTADDIFLLFFAGHGILQAGQKSFYLLTAEATAFDIAGVEKQVAISTEELNEWMRKIKANKQVLILDACNSGQAVKDLQQLIAKRDVPADQQRALENLKDKTGTYILSAAASGQAAYETSLYGQGLLTYSLLSGIKLGDALRENKYIDVTKWFNTTASSVQMMAKDIGGRQDPQIIGAASFDVGLVDKQITDNIKLSIKKKIFRRSRFIEDDDLLNDDLNLSGLIDNELNNLSVRGKESPLAFVADNTMEDAYSVRGKYEVKGTDIKLKISLFKGAKERVGQFEVTGSTDNLPELTDKILREVRSFL